MGIIVKDSLSPKLKHIENNIVNVSYQALDDAHNAYTYLQAPLVPYRTGRLLNSMYDEEKSLVNFGKNVSIKFGFEAYDGREHYAEIQEYDYPNKRVRYLGHNPTIHYFERGIKISEKVMFDNINRRFKVLLR